MANSNFSMDDCVEASERVAWKIDDVFASRKPDLTKPLLPESLAGVQGISCLDDKEKLLLNQIRGHSYAYLFNFIEETIIAAVLKQLDQSRVGDAMTARALLRFAEEEFKHQQLFRRYCREFEEALGHQCGLLSERATARDIAATVTQNPALGVLITVLHIEWVTQRHFVECVRDKGAELDPLFCDLLKFHWREEAQHTKVDLLLIDELLEAGEDFDEAVGVYMELGKAIDGLLYQQVELDVATFERVSGRKFTEEERSEVLVSQATSCRHGLLTMGMTNPPFMKFLAQHSPAASARVEEMAAAMG